jgi:hypothetical protein
MTFDQRCRGSIGNQWISMPLIFIPFERATAPEHYNASEAPVRPGKVAYAAGGAGGEIPS